MKFPKITRAYGKLVVDLVDDLGQVDVVDLSSFVAGKRVTRCRCG